MNKQTIRRVAVVLPYRRGKETKIAKAKSDPTSDEMIYELSTASSSAWKWLWPPTRRRRRGEKKEKQLVNVRTRQEENKKDRLQTERVNVLSCDCHFHLTTNWPLDDVKKKKKTKGNSIKTIHLFWFHRLTFSRRWIKMKIWSRTSNVDEDCEGKTKQISRLRKDCRCNCAYQHYKISYINKVNKWNQWIRKISKFIFWWCHRWIYFFSKEM